MIQYQNIYRSESFKGSHSSSNSSLVRYDYGDRLREILHLVT